jgi:hypothetical protein
MSKRHLFSLGCSVLLLAGCATTTIEDRKIERAGVYGALSVAQKALIDEGEIEAGISEDAVYIAWGKPDQVLQSGDKSGRTTRWIYEGTTADTHYFWEAYVITRSDGSRVLDRRMVPRTEFREYVSAELIFREGKLESWKTLPRPPSRRLHHGGRYSY